MTTTDQIQALESRQMELLKTMSDSDAHAAKCMKLGLKFKTQYPDEYDIYVAAREEYNENEEALATLKIQEAEEAQDITPEDDGTADE